MSKQTKYKKFSFSNFNQSVSICQLFQYSLTHENTFKYIYIQKIFNSRLSQLQRRIFKCIYLRQHIFFIFLTSPTILE